MWLCEGKLHSAGLPQYGQLGHGSDGEYNAKDCTPPGTCVLSCQHHVACLVSASCVHLQQFQSHSLCLTSPPVSWHIQDATFGAPVAMLNMCRLSMGLLTLYVQPKAACAAAASVKLMYAPEPKPKLIKDLAEVTITKVACGHNHTVALDDQGGAYSWGDQILFSHPPARLQQAWAMQS